MSITSPSLCRTLLGLLCSVIVVPAGAQFALAPSPLPRGEFHASAAETVDDYRKEAALHLYAAYPMNVHRGKLPPLMYAVTVVETDIDATGRVTAVRFVREPAAAKEVMPWIRSLILRAAPFPPPQKLDNGLTLTETWLVHRTGQFQLHTLSEGQSASAHALADDALPSPH